MKLFTGRVQEWGGDGLVPASCQWHGVLRGRAVPYVFSVVAAPVAQTCSLLYRRFLTCHLSPASNVLPITNRRYGRLKICATLNTYLPWGEREPFWPLSTIPTIRLSLRGAGCSLSLRPSRRSGALARREGGRERVRGNGADYP